MHKSLARLITVVLPGGEAQACTEPWYEYRDRCCQTNYMCHQRRQCMVCTGGKVCSSWTTLYKSYDSAC
jgi:hypothetical protein